MQYAVELERELLDFVLERLPLPEGTELHTVIGDARAALAELPADLRFDVVILDIFSGPEAPGHRLHRVLRGGRGASLGAGRADRECRRRAGPDARPEPGGRAAEGHDGRRRLRRIGHVHGKVSGNIILAGTRTPWPPQWTAALTARGPHPAKVLAGVELDRLSG